MWRYAQICCLAAGGLLLVNWVPAQAQSTGLAASAAGATAPETPPKLLLEDGRPVKLRIGRTVSSADAHVGDLVDFVTVYDVKVRDTTVIPKGSIAWGTVVEAHNKRRMARGGKLKIRLESAQLRDGSKAALRSEREVKGGGHAAVMATGMAVTAAAFLPATPALLFLHGKDCIILQGAEFTTYINGNFLLDPAKFDAKPAAAPVQPIPAGSAAVSSAGAQAAPIQAELSGIMDSLPRRVLDSEGNEGDMVNVLFIGGEEQLQRAFQQAGWTEAIRSKGHAVLHAAHHPRNNVAMPMSRLFLFGRSQDYGYAAGDSVSSVTRRHHIRIWKTDYDTGGSPIWVGAATHDIGIERDARKLAITHKIDPEVDAERDFVGSSMAKTQLVARTERLLPPSDPITKANTATGGQYHSDGQMLVIVLKNNGNNEERSLALSAADYKP